MKKLKILFAMLLLSSCSMFAQAIDIPLVLENPVDPSLQGTRTISVVPTVSLLESSLQICYPLPTASLVVISDSEDETIVLSATYDATRQVLLDLSTLPIGTYTLRVYAFGKWWIGEFELEDSSME